MSEFVRQMRVILQERELRRCALLLAVIFVNGIFEMVGVASIMPFMNVAMDPSLVHRDPTLLRLYEWLRFTSVNLFLFAFGGAVLLLLAAANGCEVLTRWYQYRVSWQSAHDIGMRLLRGYAARPYEFFLTRNTTEMNKQVLAEVNQFVGNVLFPLTELAARAVVTALIVTLLMFVNAALALSVILLVGGLYVAIYMGFRRRLRDMGEERLAMLDRRFKSAGEILSGIKQVKIQNCEAFFTERFEVASARFSALQAKFLLGGDIPRNLVELLAFGGVIAIVLYLIAAGRQFSQIVPLLSLYALAGYRMLPSVQKIYVSLTQVRYHRPLVRELARDLTDVGDSLPQRAPATRLPLRRSLELRNLTFGYRGGEHPVLRELTLTVPAGARTALVGPTGSGKSTLVDVITGLLVPTDGQILIDGQPLTPSNAPAWRTSIGYVPQDVFLIDDTIARNIAFGMADDAIDMALVREVAAVARIADFIETSLPGRYDTCVGERGVRLSGGQRQRLGLARALYRQPDVLILDEATSALDGITEREVIEALEALPRELTTIMIAHRLTTVRHCDHIWLIDNGRVAAAGTYDELASENLVFRRMARLAT